MKVLKNFDNKLCDRIEYTIEINHMHNRTPGIGEVKKKVAEVTKTKEDLISVKGTYTKYGVGKSITHAYIYNNINAYKKFEVRNKKKNGKKEENKGKEKAKK
tara:strand:- start:31 stop:336 length:306 start_codon:yes stop_codon:yes gene_type:complete